MKLDNFLQEFVFTIKKKEQLNGQRLSFHNGLKLSE